MYLTSEGEPASGELYRLLSNFRGSCLPIENRSIRQRNGQGLVSALKEKNFLGIASGFKPSGAYHFGHRLTATTVAYFQKNGVQVFMPIADVEADLDTDLDRETYLYWAADNLLDWGASGVNLDSAHVYLQSEEQRVNNLSYGVSRSLTFDFAIDTYGFKKLIDDFPFLLAGLVQVGDIILPQHPDFGNYHSFMVSGQDQDGHMKMTVQLVNKVLQNSNFKLLSTVPSGFYIPHMRGLYGSKQSSSLPNQTIYLGSGPEHLKVDERIEKSIEKMDQATRESKDSAMRFALDMVRFSDVFNPYSKVDFKSLLTELPTYIKNEINEQKDENLKLKMLENHIILQCDGDNQNNIDIVRSNMENVLREHQRKRELVYKHAINRAEDGNNFINFWQIPDRAKVPENRRNKTKWYDIVYMCKDKLIP